MKAHLKAAAFVALIVVMGWLVYWQYSLRAERAQQNQKQSVKVDPVPSFTAKTLSGRTIASEDYKGRILVINFWASWCGPCIEEVPSLLQLKKAMGDDLHILAISSDTILEDLQAFQKSFPEFKEPAVDLVFDGGSGLALSKMFDVARLPESYIYDGKGRLVRKVIGSINWSTPDAIEYLKTVKERP